MKIKAIESILKSAKTIKLYRGSSSEQWLSDGSAIYPIHNLPSLSDKHLFAMFDIPDDKQSKYMFEEAPLPKNINFRDHDDNEQLAQRCRITICVAGRELEPLMTSDGMILINAKYLKPFSDETLGYELYERRTKNGDIYIAVKSGMLLIGIIMQFSINGECIDELESIASGCRKPLNNTNKNKQQMTIC